MSQWCYGVGAWYSNSTSKIYNQVLWALYPRCIGTVSSDIWWSRFSVMVKLQLSHGGWWSSIWRKDTTYSLITITIQFLWRNFCPQKRLTLQALSERTGKEPPKNHLNEAKEMPNGLEIEGRYDRCKVER